MDSLKFLCRVYCRTCHLILLGGVFTNKTLHLILLGGVFTNKNLQKMTLSLTTVVMK